MEQVLNTLARLDFMEMLDLYFSAKTGNRCFCDEVLPVSLLASLYEVETHMHHYNAASILKTIQQKESDKND